MPRKSNTDTRIYVLDTNILLHEPLAFLSFKENDVVVPMTVLEELDYIKDSKKRCGSRCQGMYSRYGGFTERSDPGRNDCRRTP